MKKINYRITGTTSRSLLGACLVSVFMFFSCARENTDPLTPGGNGGGGNNLSLDTRTVPIAVANNARVYMFTGGTSNTLGNYNHQILNITRSANDLRMIARAGTWDIALLSAETASDLNNVIAPTAGTAGGSQKMFELAPSGGNLPSAPDLLTAYIDEQVIIADADNTASTSFAHNMAKVQLTIVDAKGLVTTANAHTISLGNVPTTLAWDGKLYPSKTNPTVSTTKMTGSVTVSNVAGGLQESSMLTFLVPAHRGTDFLAANPIDTTTSKLTVSVNLPLSGGGSYLKSDVVIPKVPRAGQILNVRLLIQGELTIESNILDWTNVDTNAGLSNTTLQVSKTNVALSSTDSLIVKTNASDYTFVKDAAASWLTVTKSGERLVLTANTSNYTAPRSSWVDITANNVTKRIVINQRPDVGTITVLPSPIWTSPSTGNTSRVVTVTSSGPWTIVGTPTKVTPNVTSGSATGNVTFSRKTGAILSVYGDETITFRNTNTLETTTISASNLYLDVPAQINVNGSGGTSYNDDIVVYGLSEEYTIVNVAYNATGTNWLTVSIENGRLKTTADREPNENLRWCTLTIAHKDDLTYTAQIRIEQNPYYDIIDPFTYLTGKFEWESYATDMDIAVLIYDDSGRSLLPVGNYLGYNGHYNVNAAVTFRGLTIATYGGDPIGAATSMATGGESFAIYVNAFDDLTALPLTSLDRYINIYMYAWWYPSSGVPSNGTAYLRLEYWLGGAIVSNKVGTSNAYVYTNPTGINMNPDPSPTKVISPIKARGSSSAVLATIINNSTGMTKVARVRYDRLTHKATPVWYSTADLPNWPTSNISISAAPGSPEFIPLARSGKSEFMTEAEMQEAAAKKGK